MVNGTRDRGAVLRRIYSIALGFNALVLVAFIAGSMIFTGGQVAEGGSTKWQPVWYWPVFPVPAWLLIVPAFIAAVVVIPMCIRTPARLLPRIIGAAGVAGASAASAAIFMFMFPASSGLFPLPEAGTFLGLHWIALALSLFCLLPLIVTFFVKGPEYDRLRMTGGLYSSER